MAKRLKVSRKDLFKEPDQFLSTSEKIMLFFMDNRSTAITVIVALLLAGSSFFGFKLTVTFFNFDPYINSNKVPITLLLSSRS